MGSPGRPRYAYWSTKSIGNADVWCLTKCWIRCEEHLLCKSGPSRRRRDAEEMLDNFVSALTIIDSDDDSLGEASCRGPMRRQRSAVEHIPSRFDCDDDPLTRFTHIKTDHVGEACPGHRQGVPVSNVTRWWRYRRCCCQIAMTTMKQFGLWCRAGPELLRCWVHQWVARRGFQKTDSCDVGQCSTAEEAAHPDWSRISGYHIRRLSRVVAVQHRGASRAG